LKKEAAVKKVAATPEDTLLFTKSHPMIEYGELGNTGLWASQAGFGCYRVSAGIASHETALKTALLEGINLIDTSANYADGNSEKLVGQVVSDLIFTGSLSRAQVIIVSKVGYLQGQNFEFSQQRKAQGKPFKELVDFGEELEHCIHPEFLEDQLARSLERLHLEALDFFLLHNPEYYLEWAEKHGIGLIESRAEYYRRIRTAFEYLEACVKKGRIRYYGVSSNSFPVPSDHFEFTSLDALWRIAESLSPDHHFRLIQLPLNLMEPGAVLEKNQPGGKSVLELAAEREMAVLTNRPLNALSGQHLFRLADVQDTERFSTDDIIDAIRALGRSEKKFLQGVLPGLDLAIPLRNRVTEQLAIGDILKHHWRHFGSYERWREVKQGHLLARVRGVMDFLAPHRENIEGLPEWMNAHMAHFNNALSAIESIYSESVAIEARRINRLISAADSDWAKAPTLSQRAIRAPRTTTGVSAVLVGMRRVEYVTDVLSELSRPGVRKPSVSSWEKMHDARKTL
jgi:aryl-alcohol dehydrogenase-like predicted oxidoreductase